MKAIWNKIYRTIVVAIIIFGLIFIILSAFGILAVARGEGPSMEPNYTNKRYLMIKTGNYTRGDVVGGQLDGRLIMKRIIACPGDKLLIGHSNIWIDSEIYPENYISYENEGWNDFGEYDVEMTLGDDEYFVMGDNRRASQDSRHFGTISEDMIIGEVIHK